MRPPITRRLKTLGLATVGMTVAISMTAPPALAAPAEGTIRNAGGETAIADSYIVVLKDSAVAQAAVGAKARDLASRYDGAVARTYSTAIRGFEIKTTAVRAKQLAANPAVAYVEQNHTVTIQDTQTNPPSWGLDRIDQRALPLSSSYTYPNTAGTVHAYIVDTGILFGHTNFGGRAVSGHDAVDGGTADDCNGHGTHVAGTVGGSTFGVAKAVQLVGVRVLDCAGSGSFAGVLAGVEWVTANAIKPAVANMSLGGAASSSTAALETAVANSIASGVTYAIAAGNGNSLGVPQNACNFAPARVPAAITVAASTSADAAASFTNYGTCVDIIAPGVSITSAWYTGTSATNTISGTSMAAPHVAGAAALLLEANPTWTPAQVAASLVASSTPNVVTGLPGSGTPNRLLYVESGPPPANDFSVSASPTSGTVTAGGSVTTTVSTATTAGAAQTVSLAASGLPTGVTAAFSPTSVTSGGSSTLTLTTAATTAAGTYPITVSGSGSGLTRTATYTLNVAGAPGCTGSNSTDVSIPDNGAAVTSPITISGCGRAPSTTSTIAVNIVHTYRGDLVIDLVAPDGTAFRLKNSSNDSADNINTTYTANVSGETANGTWLLRVQDVVSIDTGYINTWTLTL